LVSLLKVSVPRDRPSGENDTSFPSFHASTTTTVATIIQHYYGWKWGIPAYAVAGFVAYSRIESERHYLSDVIFGATIGYISAITAIRGTDRSVEQRRLAVVPIIGNQRRGVAVHLEF
jgi:membrane-associated phospholipid phosphatase